MKEKKNMRLQTQLRNGIGRQTKLSRWDEKCQKVSQFQLREEKETAGKIGSQEPRERFYFHLGKYFSKIASKSGTVKLTRYPGTLDEDDYSLDGYCCAAKSISRYHCLIWHKFRTISEMESGRRNPEGKGKLKGVRHSLKVRITIARFPADLNQLLGTVLTFTSHFT